MLVWTVWANRLSYRQKRHRCSHLRIIPSAEMKPLLPSLRSYLHVFHNYQGCWHENWKQTQLTKYHHESGDAEEEYTFIVDLSSRSQRAQCWCRCTTARLACQSGWRGVSGKAQPRFAQTTPSGRRGLLVWSLPSLCCRKRVKCTLLEPQTPLSGVVKTNPGRPNSGFVSELDAQKHPQWLYLCLWFQHESCIVCLERESWVFLCLFSACVTAKVQTICGSCFSFCSQQQGAVWE